MQFPNVPPSATYSDIQEMVEEYIDKIKVLSKMNAFLFLFRFAKDCRSESRSELRAISTRIPQGIPWKDLTHKVEQSSGWVVGWSLLADDQIADQRRVAINVVNGFHSTETLVSKNRGLKKRRCALAAAKR